MTATVRPVLCLLATAVLSSCATPPPAPLRVAVDTEQYNRGQRVEIPALPRQLLFSSTYRPLDKAVRTASFRDGRGDGYFAIAFQRLPGKAGAGDMTSVVVTKAYCATTTQISLGISPHATIPPYCEQRTDLPVKVTTPRAIELIAPKSYTIDLGDGDRIVLHLVEATASP